MNTTCVGTITPAPTSKRTTAASAYANVSASANPRLSDGA
jgi:hypothetical protein